jgi:YidC/Oxa1 family membrane protein insertase
MASSQKYMAYIVPLFALSGLYWQFGLVLYWVTTNVWTLGQQYVLFKRYPAPVVTAAPGAAGKAADGSPAEPGKKPAPGGATRGGAPAPAAGLSANGAGGMLRRLGRARNEPEPKPAEPETKLVRQQPQRQSRSKRSGKR